MTLRRIDYYTIAGIAIFLILEAGYFLITSLGLKISLDPSNISVGYYMPNIGLPNLNMDWFNHMDPVSRILFAFLVMVVGGTAIGCAGLLMKYRRNRAH